jgi:hypothetical protein
MAALRALTLAALLAFAASGLALAQTPVDWYTDTGSGGVLAQPPGESRDGGALSPRTASGIDEGPDSDISATPPVASPSQAEPVLGEERAESEPAPELPEVAPAQEPEPPAAPEPRGSVGEALPFTGLELAALAGVGVCLLIAGLALRPRRAV